MGKGAPLLEKMIGEKSVASALPIGQLPRLRETVVCCKTEADHLASALNITTMYKSSLGYMKVYQPSWISLAYHTDIP